MRPSGQSTLRPPNGHASQRSTKQLPIGDIFRRNNMQGKHAFSSWVLGAKERPGAFIIAHQPMWIRQAHLSIYLSLPKHASGVGENNLAYARTKHAKNEEQLRIGESNPGLDGTGTPPQPTSGERAEKADESVKCWPLHQFGENQGYTKRD
ncbi:hypothetical protein CHU98_g3521 [Xylaria longipes]|nr:hypothetical protein CHU98_g3521 [Xylaria longipes]